MVFTTADALLLTEPAGDAGFGRPLPRPTVRADTEVADGAGARDGWASSDSDDTASPTGFLLPRAVLGGASCTTSTERRRRVDLPAGRGKSSPLSPSASTTVAILRRRLEPGGAAVAAAAAGAGSETAVTSSLTSADGAGLPRAVVPLLPLPLPLPRADRPVAVSTAGPLLAGGAIRVGDESVLDVRQMTGVEPREALPLRERVDLASSATGSSDAAAAFAARVERVERTDCVETADAILMMLVSDLAGDGNAPGGSSFTATLPRAPLLR